VLWFCDMVLALVLFFTTSESQVCCMLRM
jgi:hypothetical protein